MTNPRAALALLLAINLFNYIDRYILAAVLPKVGAQFNVGKDKQGLLMSAFLVSYTLTAPVFGWLGDRTSRWRIIALGVILWSLASGGTGLVGAYPGADLARAYVVLLLTRTLIGVGEAAYGPVAPSLISDLFPVDRRGGVMAWFYMAIPVGSALGFAFGGLVADHFTWQDAFYWVVPPGVLLGLLCLRMREPPRGAADAMIAHRPTVRDAAVLFDIPSYVLNTLAMTAMTFAFGGVATWMPTYLYEREGTYAITADAYARMRAPKEPGVTPVPEEVIARLAPVERHGEFRTVEPFRAALAECLDADEMYRYRGQLAEAARVAEKSASLGSVSSAFGGIVVVAGLVATLSGGYLADWLRRRRLRGAYFAVSGVGMLLGVPFYWLAIVSPLPAGWAFVFLAVFFLFFNTGPANTALANVAPPALRASAFALNILAIHLFGDVVSPPAVGWVDERDSLRAGMQFLAAPMVLSGLFWLWGTRHLDRDTELAPTRIGGA